MSSNYLDKQINLILEGVPFKMGVQTTLTTIPILGAVNYGTRYLRGVDTSLVDSATVGGVSGAFLGLITALGAYEYKQYVAATKDGKIDLLEYRIKKETDFKKKKILQSELGKLQNEK